MNVNNYNPNTPFIKVTEDTRAAINKIIESRYHTLLDDKGSENKLLTFRSMVFSHRADYEYHSIFTPGKNNVAYGADDTPVMSIFDFTTRQRVELLKMLGLSDTRPSMCAIRVPPNTVVPMHVDYNKGETGRDLPTYSIVTSGVDGAIFISATTDGNSQFMIPGKTDYILCPTLIAHGARSGTEPYTLLQIQMKSDLAY